MYVSYILDLFCAFPHSTNRQPVQRPNINKKKNIYIYIKEIWQQVTRSISQKNMWHGSEYVYMKNNIQRQQQQKSDNNEDEINAKINKIKRIKSEIYIFEDSCFIYIF